MRPENVDHHRGNAGAAAESMNAYVYVAPHELRVTRVPRPFAREDSAVMKVSVSSICGTDVRTYRFGNDSLQSPRTIGHEACGVIYEKGKGVKGFAEGDRVFVVPAIGCGTCRSCRSGHTNMCESLRTIGFEFDGTFAQYMEIPPQALAMGNVITVPPSLSDAEASLIEPVACCLNGQRFLRIEPEDTVCIFGAGFIGCMHALLASKSGCERIIIVDVSQRRIDFVSPLLPLVEFIDSSRTDPASYLKETTSGRGVDVVITAAPVGATHRIAMEISARRARISLFGGLPGDATGFLNSNVIHYKELSVFGSHASTVEENRHILGLVSEKDIDIVKFATKACPLEQIENAFEALKNESVLKVLIAP
jgi:L-iditol 2-dehydrogenase